MPDSPGLTPEATDLPGDAEAIAVLENIADLAEEGSINASDNSAAGAALTEIAGLAFSRLREVEEQS